MHSLTPDDHEFEQRVLLGEVRAADFDHRAHLRLAYIQIAQHGPEQAVAVFRRTLIRFLEHHGIDPVKYHETLTRAWLLAVGYFMRKAGSTSGSDDFLARCVALHEPKVMLSHYSRECLNSEAARQSFVAPDLDPIPVEESRSGAGAHSGRARQ
ncbi:MAG: hypothetical protein R3E77_16440 [Steroidobacteraceae bacterium]